MHDEILAEDVPERMGKAPGWTPGLLLNADEKNEMEGPVRKFGAHNIDR